MTPDQQAIIISQTAQGATTRDIEDMIGLDHSNVARHQARLRPYIDRETARIINSGLSVSRKVLTRTAAEGLRQWKQPAPDKDLLKLSLDASKTILNVAGITGNPSTVIQTLINIDNRPQSNETLTILKDFLTARMHQPTTEVIDVQ